MATAFGSSASRSAAGGSFCSYDLGSSLGVRLLRVRGKRYVELEGVAFDAESFCYRRTSSLLYSPRSGSPDYSPASPDYTPLTPPSQRSGSPDYSPATPEYTPLTPSSSQRSGSPVYSPATPEYTPLTPSSSQRYGSPDYSPATPEYTPVTPSSSQRYGSLDYSPATPEYTPVMPSSQRSGSPRYSPATPEYTPLTPPKRSGSPAYTPATVYYTHRTPSGCVAASPEYTPAIRVHAGHPGVHAFDSPRSSPACFFAGLHPELPFGVRRCFTHVSTVPPPPVSEEPDQLLPASPFILPAWILKAFSSL